MKQQRGVALIAAIFVIVVLGLAVVVMSVLAVRSSQQTTQSLLALRAEQAAASAIDYTTQRLVASAAKDCSVVPASLSLDAFSDYAITLGCSANNYNRPSDAATLLTITATVEFGTVNSSDYVWRQMHATVEF